MPLPRNEHNRIPGAAGSKLTPAQRAMLERLEKGDGICMSIYGVRGSSWEWSKPPYFVRAQTFQAVRNRGWAEKDSGRIWRITDSGKEALRNENT